MPFFSIIIPTYNRAAFIARAVESVLAQNFGDWELIVIDDCSSDETGSVLSKFSDVRIQVIRNEVNLERSKSRNKGIAKASGKYVCFLDSDDTYHEAHLEIIFRAIEERHRPVGLFFTNVEKYDEAKKSSLPFYVIFNEREAAASVIINNIPVICACIHRSVLDDITFPEQVSINEDVWFFARICSKYRAFKVDAYTAVWHFHGGNTINTTKDYYTPQIEACQLMLKDPLLQVDRVKAVLKERLAEVHLSLIHHLANRSNYRAAFRSLGGLTRVDPSFKNLRTAVAHLFYSTHIGRNMLGRKLKAVGQ